MGRRYNGDVAIASGRLRRRVPISVQPPAAANSAVQLVQVQIPFGLVADMGFQVHANGRMLQVSVPPGLRGGQMLMIQIPAGNEAPAKAKQVRMRSVTVADSLDGDVDGMYAW